MQVDEQARKDGSSVSVLESEKLQKLSRAFNFNQQELSQGYQTSMTCYADDRAYSHFMENTLRPKPADKTSQPLLTLNETTSIVDFVNQAVIQELLQSERIAGNIFLTQMKTYCKLKENLQLVHSIYFMEAGHHMHLFASELFDDLDTN